MNLVSSVNQIKFKQVMTESKGEFTTSPFQAPQLMHESSPLTDALDVKQASSKQSLPLQTHPLHSSWQFWYYQRQSPQQYYAQNQPEASKDKPEATEPEMKPWKGKQKQKTYREQLKPLGLIPSVEHFFNFYVFMKRPSEMPREVDIFFFRNEEVPMWEVSQIGALFFAGVTAGRSMDHQDQA
jgi:hypothetical protein